MFIEDYTQDNFQVLEENVRTAANIFGPVFGPSTEVVVSFNMAYISRDLRGEILDLYFPTFLAPDNNIVVKPFIL